MLMIRGQILSPHNVADFQTGIVSDILAVPRELLPTLSGRLPDYEMCDPTSEEQIAWLTEMAHAEIAHRSHAASVIPLVDSRVAEA
jgi:hypothetical protein